MIPNYTNGSPTRTPSINRNEQIQLDARERIRRAIADLLERGSLPMGITERYDALVFYRISGQTLYRHRDLWHPRYLQNETIGELQSDAGQDCAWTAPCLDSHTNLLGESGCNTLPEGDSSDLECPETKAIGCNSPPTGDLSHAETRNMTQEEGIAYIKQVLNQGKVRRQVETAQKRQRLAGCGQLSLPFDRGLM